MSYSEWGPSNGQIYKRPIGTGLNHSGSIPLWFGDLPVQLQGLNLMRVSHSWTPKLNILEILKHFWPASEHCRQATISIWTLYFLCVPYFRHLSTLYIWRHGHAQLIHSSLSNLGTISLKSGNLRVKMSYSEGVHQTGKISKRPDRYRAESFRVDSNMIGWSTCAVTRSNLMRVSHSWTPKLNILEILKHFWPASEPCIQATFIFPVRALTSVTHPHCIYEGMGMHSWPQ